MPGKRLLIILIVLLPLINACHSSRRVQKTVAQSATTSQLAQNYISIYKDIAVNEMKRTGIPASITLAQGMVESDFGRSTLATKANNHFGIKCHNDWTGPSILQDDDQKDDCFRKYSSPENSFYDHSEFLRTRPRYSFLFDIATTDYKAWAHGLRKAGYATNPDYAGMLIRKIEENNLEQYDIPGKNGKKYAATKKQDNISQPSSPAALAQKTDKAPADSVSADTATVVPVIAPSEKSNPGTAKFNPNMAVYATTPRIRETNKLQYIIVKDGETVDDLEKEFSVMKWELVKYNELATGFIPVAGQILFLQAKREKAEPGKEYHIAEQGETMYLISQKYGIKVRSLYAMNKMEEGTEPAEGTKLWLRAVKP